MSDSAGINSTDLLSLPYYKRQLIAVVDDALAQQLAAVTQNPNPKPELWQTALKAAGCRSVRHCRIDAGFNRTRSQGPTGSARTRNSGAYGGQHCGERTYFSSWSPTHQRSVYRPSREISGLLYGRTVPSRDVRAQVRRSCTASNVSWCNRDQGRVRPRVETRLRITVEHTSCSVCFCWRISLYRKAKPREPPFSSSSIARSVAHLSKRLDLVPSRADVAEHCGRASESWANGFFFDRKL